MSLESTARKVRMLRRGARGIKAVATISHRVGRARGRMQAQTGSRWGRGAFVAGLGAGAVATRLLGNRLAHEGLELDDSPTPTADVESEMFRPLVSLPGGGEGERPPLRIAA